MRLNIAAGQGPAAMARGELLVDTNTAKSQHLHVGSVVPVTFARTGDTTMRVGGIYEYNPLVGSYLTGAGYFLAHFDHPLIDAVLISAAPGARGVGRALNRALNSYPNLSIQSRAQFRQSQQKTVNSRPPAWDNERHARSRCAGR